MLQKGLVATGRDQLLGLVRTSQGMVMLCSRRGCRSSHTLVTAARGMAGLQLWVSLLDDDEALKWFRYPL